MEIMEKKFEQWKHAVNMYYNSSEPIMSDDAFDKLTEDIIKWAEQNPSTLSTEILTTIKKGISRQTGIEIVDDRYSGMQVSLKKLKIQDVDFRTQLYRFFKNNLNAKYLVAPKLDGISIRIDFKNGNRIYTRGGQDITSHLYKNPTINKAIKNYGHLEQINGELLLNKTIFKHYYSSTKANERNTVAGFIGTKEPNYADLALLTFIPCTDGTNPLVDQKLPNDEYLWKPYNINNTNKEEHSIFERFKSDEFDFRCDGIVIATHTSKRIIENNYPMNMVAVKFPSSVAETKVLNHIWEVGKTGEYSCRLEIEPVQIDGSTVTFVTGNNHDFVARNGLGIGACITITKSGDIIPKVQSILKPSYDIPIPEEAQLVDNKLVTKNTDHIKRVRFEKGFLVLMEATDTKGLGPVNINDIGMRIDYNILRMFNQKDIEDLRRIYLNSSVGEKLDNIFMCKNFTHAQIINMIQISNVGNVLSEWVADFVLGNKHSASGVPTKVYNNIRYMSPKLKSIFNELTNRGYTLYTEKDDKNIIEMTGNPPGMTKSEFIKLLNEKTGGNNYIQGSLTKRSYCLLTDDINSSTSKMNKARKLNIPIYTYQSFLEKLN